MHVDAEVAVRRARSAVTPMRRRIAAGSARREAIGYAPRRFVRHPRREARPTGVTVLLREARLAPVAEVQVWASVGSADERPGRGRPRALPRAHALQGHRDARRRRGRGRRRGRRAAASTPSPRFDATCYHATLPSDALGARGSTCWPTRCSTRASTPPRWRARSRWCSRRSAAPTTTRITCSATRSSRPSTRCIPYRAPVLGSARERVVLHEREAARASTGAGTRRTT